MNELARIEAEALRAWVEGDLEPLRAIPGYPRIYLPIVREEATGKARCRLCTRRIEKGQPVIAFQVDWLAPDPFGRLTKAYLHDGDCPAGKDTATAAAGPAIVPGEKVTDMEGGSS